MANQAQKLDFIVIKLGSSTLTEAGQPNHALIAGLCDDLHALRLQNLSPVLVTSGAVQLGCSASTQDGGSARTRAGRAAIGQIRLVAAFSEHLSRQDYRAAQILLKREDFASPRTRTDIAEALRSISSSNGIALINENDVTSANSGFPSNDELGAALVELLDAPMLVIFTDRPGVYDADPRTHPNARLFDTVGAFDERLLAAATDIPTSTGTGGMRSKILAARTAAAHGSTTVIARYDEPGKLLRIVQGERQGTWIVPDSKVGGQFDIKNIQFEEEY